MKHFFLLLLLCVTLKHVGSAQGYILLKNNEKIRFEKFKMKQGFLEVDLPGKGKTEKLIGTDSIQGYYTDYGEIFYHLKPVTNQNATIPYQFIERYICGKIKLYKETTLHTSQYS